MLLVAALCVRAAMVRILPSSSPTLDVLAPTYPPSILDQASDALVRQRGILSPATLTAVEEAAAAAPLDARAYLILGHQRLLDGQPERALRTLEAGRRLDPRQRLIHLLLLDRYLRTGRYTDAATEFSVLARLMGPTQEAIATAMAAMSLAPETRGAVRRTLAIDPQLERSVLTALARSATAPATIFSLATPRARAEAGRADNWGPVLIGRMVEAGQFTAARAVWARIYRLPATGASTPIFNAAFVKSPASAPFNWTLTSSSLGAAEMRRGGLAVDYYGRDSGDLAQQLLVLSPGRYRFSVDVEPGKTDAGARLAWTVSCITGEKEALLRLPVTAGSRPRRLFGAFNVPAGCPAQTLALRGEAGELPVPVTLVLRNPVIERGPRP